MAVAGQGPGVSAGRRRLGVDVGPGLAGQGDRAVTTAETAKERATGNLDTHLRDIRDQVWPRQRDAAVMRATV